MFFKDEKEYKEYLEKNKITQIKEDTDKYFEWSEDGEILLEKGTLRESGLDVQRYTNCISWGMLKDNTTMVLLKSQFGDIYRQLSMDDYNITMYNNILLPQIAKKMQNESAIYYIAKNKTTRKRGNDRKYLLTPDFKDKDEYIIHGEEILDETGLEMNEVNIEKIINSTEEYLKKNGATNYEIQDIRKEFIKQSLFNRLIKHCDENNHNWGILKNERTNTYRIAPLYDIECSCEINKWTKIIRKTNDGSTNNLESFVEQFKNREGFKEYIEEILEDFDLEEAFRQAKEETKKEIPDKYKERYRNFFAIRFRELKEAYKQVYMSKEQENEEEKSK